MKRLPKHKRILMLMILSQLLLTGFVVQWLISQYRDEKNLLSKDLNGFYINSHDEALDTLLYQIYVEPALSENHAVTIIRRKDPDSSENNLHVQYSKAKEPNDSTLIISIADSTGKHNISVNRKIVHNNILKSVKLIVAHLGDTADLKNHGVVELSSEIDTARFKKFFNEKVKDNGMRFHISWDSAGNTLKHIKKSNALLVEPLHGYPLPYAKVSGFTSYLFGRITTQIIFGIVLILITALAFVLSYRNIHNNLVLNSIREEFISNITHELKTPVSTIMVALEALGNFNVKKEPDTTAEYINLATQETKRLNELINKVLDQSLLDKKYQPLSYSIFDLNHLVHEVIDVMKMKSGADSRIVFNQGDEALMLSGDSLYIKGVLINLIDNSIKYCDKDPVIEISAKKKDHEVIIEIKDNGPGIPEEYKKRIFEKFFRLPSANIHNVKGYGLGLSFARTVMELHKGSIEMRNLNPGCVFILKFPAE